MVRTDVLLKIVFASPASKRALDSAPTVAISAERRLKLHVE